MTPEQKCVSLDTARKLKEEGFSQDTERMWEGIMHDVNVMRYKLKRFRQNGNPELFAAPDAQEIGVLLKMEPKPEVYFETTRIAFAKWTVRYAKQGRSKSLFFYMGDNEAEARAAAWLWLKDNGLL